MFYSKKVSFPALFKSGENIWRSSKTRQISTTLLALSNFTTWYAWYQNGRVRGYGTLHGKASGAIRKTSTRACNLDHRSMSHSDLASRGQRQARKPCLCTYPRQKGRVGSYRWFLRFILMGISVCSSPHSQPSANRANVHGSVSTQVSLNVKNIHLFYFRQ